MVESLVAAIRRLDYPAEKLDVKFVLEADDAETRDALARLALGAPFEIVIAPPIGPRTKPKALNVALPLARGLYTTSTTPKMCRSPISSGAPPRPSWRMMNGSAACKPA